MNLVSQPPPSPATLNRHARGFLAPSLDPARVSVVANNHVLTFRCVKVRLLVQLAAELRPRCQRPFFVRVEKQSFAARGVFVLRLQFAHTPLLLQDQVRAFVALHQARMLECTR